MGLGTTGIVRVRRPRREAGLTYDRLSGWYDRLAEPGERPARQAGLRDLDVRQGESVLEIGFGTGAALVPLARAVGPTGRVLGIELSRGKLAAARRRVDEAARRRVDEAGLTARTFLQLGDAVDLPYECDAFDAILLSFTLELFDTPDIPRVLDECRRVLRSGGRIAVVALSRQPGVMTRPYEWGHALLPRYLDCRPIRAGEALESAGLAVHSRRLLKTWGLSVEVVVGVKARERA